MASLILCALCLYLGVNLNGRISFAVESPDQYDYWYGLKFDYNNEWVVVVFRCAAAGRPNAMAIKNRANPDWVVFKITND